MVDDYSAEVSLSFVVGKLASEKEKRKKNNINNVMLHISKTAWCFNLNQMLLRYNLLTFFQDCDSLMCL